MELITNRTQADVDRAKELWSKGWQNLTLEEKNEWLAGMKGAYNYTDWNRVESAVAQLAEVLGIDLETKTDWAIEDEIKYSDQERYLNNIAILRERGGCLVNTPPVPGSLSKLTYSLANDIEQILVDIETAVKLFSRCGEVYCGEV